MALFPQSLTFIICLSKCRIGDVFKHSIFYFLYLFRMYEEGGGQMTCYWYVLISLKLFLIVFIWEEMIHCTVPTIRYISNTKLRCYQTLNSVNFVSNHYEKFTDRFAGMTWNCHIGYMIFFFWEKTFILLSALELIFVEFHEIRGCV